MDSFWVQAFFNSLCVVVGVCSLSVMISLPVAWLVERTDIPRARALGRILSLPYVVPSYLLAVSWITLANPSVGWINQLGTKLFGHTPLLNIYNLAGIIFIETSALFAILFLNFRAGLAHMDPSLEEAARLAGAKPIRIFFSITCPLLKTTIVSSVIAIGLAALASFGVPAMIGGPARLFVLTTGIFSLLRQGNPEAYQESLIIALEMGLVALVLVALSRFWSKKEISLVGGKSARPSLVKLGMLRPVASIFVWSLWIIFAALPIATLVLSSFQTIPGQFSISNLSLRAWKYVLFTLPDFRRAIYNSLAVSTIAAVIIIFLSLTVALISWQVQQTGRRVGRTLARIVEDTALLLYSLPGTVLAVLLIFVAAKFSSLELSDTLTIIVVALILKYLALGFRTVMPAAYLVEPSLIEAARLSGARTIARVWLIWLPLLRPALLSAAMLIVMPCLAELTMSILLCGPGTETIGVNLFQLQEYADRASASVVGSLLLASVMGFQLFAGRFSRGY